MKTYPFRPHALLFLAAVSLIPVEHALAQVPAPPPVGSYIEVLERPSVKPPTEEPKPRSKRPADEGGKPTTNSSQTEPESGSGRSALDRQLEAEEPQPALKGPDSRTTRAPLTVEKTGSVEASGAMLARRQVRSGSLGSGTRAGTKAEPEEPVKEPATVGQALESLQRFEEEAFPEPGPKQVLPDNLDGLDGLVPPRPEPRPGAENPPLGLRSEGQSRAGAPSRTEAAPEAPEAWISRLALPDMPVRLTPRVIRYLEFYQKDPHGRAIMRYWLRRMGRFQQRISEALRRHEMPQALIFVAMIESSFDPRRTSYAGAAGLWQFMPGPGKGYGLERTYWVDLRRDPERSTEAALTFLKELHTRFGTWELALAAYNAGYYGVLRAVQKYNTNDYWTLCSYEAGLPWSTVLYVPKIMAAAIVAQNRAFFGFEDVKPDAELTHELVAVSASITLDQAARAAGVSVEQMELLNPELRRRRTPPGPKAWLRVPVGRGEAFYAGLVGLKGELSRYTTTQVRLGETCKTMARAYRTSCKALRQINGLTVEDDLRPGLTVLVPANSPAAPTTVEGEAEEALLVPLPAGVPEEMEGRRRIFYRVVSGDTVEEVARYLGLDAAQLASWNSLDLRAHLMPGMVLQAFVLPEFDDKSVVLLDPGQVQVMVAGSEDFLNLYEQRKGRKRLVYTVREGETLSSIGRRVGLTDGDLARINQFPRTTALKAGEKIVVYLAKDKQKPKSRKARRRGTSNKSQTQTPSQPPTD